MLDEMSKAKYLVCGPFPVTGVAPGGFVDGSGIDNVGLLIDAGLLKPVVEPTVTTKKSTKPEQAGEEE